MNQVVNMQGGQEQSCNDRSIIQEDETSSTKLCKMLEPSIDPKEVTNETTPLTTNSDIILSANPNCDSDPISNSRIFVNTDDETKVLISDGTLVNRTDYITDLSDINGALKTSCDTSGCNETNKLFPKPILSNGGGPTPLPRQIPKKSVSFDTDDEKIQKFISGEIIVDQQNPFKNAIAAKRAEFFSRNYVTQKSQESLAPDEFITTEEVLKESKYVKTYIKNPDKYFQYDPNLAKKLRTEIALENRKCIPVKIPKVPKTTNERFKDLKNKYSPLSKLRNGSVPSKDKSDRTKYPNLSEIKVKVGTDLEESLFNPEEVTLNAKKFDARIKNTSFGSQDDLDDIADLTSTSLESVVENPKCGHKADDELDRADVNDGKQPKKTFTNTVNSKEFQEYLKKKGLSIVPDWKSTDTNLENSDETISYRLEMQKHKDMEEKKVKKPSVLQRLFPSRMFSKRRTTPQEAAPEPKTLYSTSEEDVSRPNEVKRVILERNSFYGGSYRPNTSYANDQEYKDKSGKYVIDDGSSSISSALTNAEDYIDVNVRPKQTRNDQKDNKENYLEVKTNRNLPAKYEVNSKERNSVARYPEQIIPKPAPRASTSLTVDSDRKQVKIKPISRLKPVSGRSSVPIVSLSDRIDQIRNTNPKMGLNSAIPTPIKQKIDQPVLFESKSPDARDGIVKPRVHRPIIPVVNQKSNQITFEPQDIRQVMSPFQRTSERQSLDYRKPSDNMYGNLTRTVSMNKAEVKRRNLSRQLERPKAVGAEGIPAQIKIYPASNAGPHESQTRHVLSLSKNSNVSLEDPQGCSTPINQPEIVQFPQNGDFYFHKKSNNTGDPKSTRTVPASNLDLDTYSWAKLRELKEQTDRQLYRKQIENPNKNFTPQNIYGKANDPARQENLYEKLPSRDGRSMPNMQIRSNTIFEQGGAIEPQQRQGVDTIFKPSNQRLILIQSQAENEAFVRHSPQRNTIGSAYRSRELKPINEKSLNETRLETIPTNQILTRKYQPVFEPNRDYGRPVTEQPVRCQSAMGEIISRDSYGSMNSGSPLPVVMRRRQTGTISREEIMKRLTEFYRKSTSKTPTKNLEESNGRGVNNNLSPVKLSSCEVSPNSYASIDSHAKRSICSNRSSGKVAPQVPQRIQSLQSANKLKDDQISSIYAPIYKNYSTQSSSVSDILSSPSSKRISYSSSPSHQMPERKQTYSDSDSVFIVEESDKCHKKPVPLPAPRSYVVMNSEQITPTQVLSYRNPSMPIKQITPHGVYGSNQNVDIYGRIYPKDGQYGYVQLKNPQPVGGKVSQIYFPANSGILANHIRADGRVTPLVLHAIPSQQFNTKPIPKYNYDDYGDVGKIVVLNNTETMYRPIVASNNEVPRPQIRQSYVRSGHHIMPYESESASEAEEVQRILQTRQSEEDWQNEKARNQQNEQVTDDRRRAGRRDDPRRHTLGTDMLGYAQGQGPPQRAMDLEAPPVRGYTPVNQGPLFDDDPGIMSEVETASTGFRRGGKQRSSLPVVRTPSKTLERPLGLVFLQYRSETKRALLPNEITSIDTVRALFVRSFPRQLTMAYLEGPNVKIYIHDASKDMFYELEDVRSHLREIRDRSVLRLFESNEVAAPQVLPGGPGVPQPLTANGGHWDQDQSYFSEPEFDSEYQHQHIHKSKGGKGAQYYVGGAQTLPRGMYSDRNKNVIDGYMSSPERGTRGGYEEPYYSQYGTRGISITPIIDEEQSESSLNEDQYAMYGHKVSGRIPRSANQMYDPTRPEDLHRIRVEHMERQLANLTGLVQKALTQNVATVPTGVSINQNYLNVTAPYRDKSVSFEKSVSFSDDIQGAPKPHIPQHPERDRLKPPPPPKPLGLAPAHNNYRPDIALAPEVYNHLRGLQKKAKDLRMEMRTLRRLSQAQAVAVREDIKDAFMGIRATLMASSGTYWGQGDQDKMRLSREEEMYKQEVIRLEKDLSDLESSVEGLRGEVINRRTRVNMTAVEDMALVLSRASKTVAELKMKFPSLQNGLRNILSNEMEKVVREEKFLKDEPDRLESALRRCKKLTGTLVTLKRLASVQEQRLPCADPPADEAPRSSDVPATNKPIPSPRLGTVVVSGGVAPENALDALLDELQTFAKPPTGNSEPRPDDSTSDDSSQTLQSTVTTQLSQTSLYPTDPQNSNVGLRRLHSYPSGSDTDTSPPQPSRATGKPPVPERNADLLTKVGGKRIPPPPPPRTSSRSPLASPTSPNVPVRMPSLSESSAGDQQNNCSGGEGGNSSGNESSHSQEHGQRQLVLELRHQELLKKQKQLQEQYARLQQISKASALPTNDLLHLKKTGSESNLPQKMGLNMAVSGSMKNLNMELNIVDGKKQHPDAMATTTKQVYETDIL